MTFPILLNTSDTLKNWRAQLIAKFSAFAEGDTTRVGVEVETNKRWINGEKIYKKTFKINSFPNATEDTYDLNVAHSFVIAVYGIMTDGANFLTLPWVYYTGINTAVTAYTVAGQLKVAAGIDRSGYSGYITVEYIK